MRTLKAYAGVTTFNIVVHEDQSSDELLGILPPTTTAAEGILAWSIGFSDAFRAPSTSSSSTGATEDALLGPVGAIVGPNASQGRSVLSRPIFLYSLNSNNTPVEDSTFPAAIRATFSFTGSLGDIILFASPEVTPSSNPVSSSRTMPFPDTFGVVNNPFEAVELKPLAPSSFLV